MIRYSLTCDKAHAFEGWFASGDGFDKQVKRKQVTCPTCGSVKVEKALMAPNVVTSRKKAARRVETEMVAPPTPPAPVETAHHLVASPQHRELMKQLRRVRDEVLAKSEYVGPRFAEEARRIHNEETAPRGIHGEATPDDVKALSEDGIDVFPVPILPEDQN
jgi:hypothetical protein